MGIRKSTDERLVLDANREEILERLTRQLPAAGFSQVTTNAELGQVSAQYRKATVWGQLLVTLRPAMPGGTEVELRSTANTDNAFALFSSPNGKILAAAKAALTG